MNGRNIKLAVSLYSTNEIRIKLTYFIKSRSSTELAVIELDSPVWLYGKSFFILAQKNDHVMCESQKENLTLDS